MPIFSNKLTNPCLGGRGVASIKTGFSANIIHGTRARFLIIQKLCQRYSCPYLSFQVLMRFKINRVSEIFLGLLFTSSVRTYWIGPHARAKNFLPSLLLVALKSVFPFVQITLTPLSLSLALSLSHSSLPLSLAFSLFHTNSLSFPSCEKEFHSLFLSHEGWERECRSQNNFFFIFSNWSILFPTDWYFFSLVLKYRRQFSTHK